MFKTKQEATHLGRAHDEHGPPRLHLRLSAARVLLDLVYLAERPLQARGHVLVDVLEVLDEAHLVAVAGEERRELLVVHRAVDRALRDLESVDVHDRDHRARLGGVDVLVPMPRAMNEEVSGEGQGGKREDTRCGGTGLGFAISDDADDDEVWLVHDSTERDAERVSELATFVDGAWRLGIDVTVPRLFSFVLVSNTRTRTSGTLPVLKRR